MSNDLLSKGFLDIPIDFSLDLFAEITKLKKEKREAQTCMVTGRYASAGIDMNVSMYSTYGARSQPESSSGLCRTVPNRVGMGR